VIGSAGEDIEAGTNLGEDLFQIFYLLLGSSPGPSGEGSFSSSNTFGFTTAP